MAPFFSLSLSYIIIAMYRGKIMICTSIQPGWHALQGATKQTVPLSPHSDSLSSFFSSLALPQQTRGICYLSPNLLCFLSQWLINRVLLSISKDTEARGGGKNRERGRVRLKMLERQRGRRRARERVYELRCLWRCHSCTVCWFNGRSGVAGWLTA